MNQNITHVIYNESLNGFIDKSGSVSTEIRMAETFLNEAQCKVEIQRRSRMYKEVPSYDEQNWKIKKVMIALIAEDALLPPPPEQPDVCQLPANPDGAVVTEIPAAPVVETPAVVESGAVLPESPVPSPALVAETKAEEVPIVLAAINPVG